MYAGNGTSKRHSPTVLDWQQWLYLSKNDMRVARAPCCPSLPLFFPSPAAHVFFPGLRNPLLQELLLCPRTRPPTVSLTEPLP
jgi:hypothetical protein